MQFDFLALNKGQQAFIDQQARAYLVLWADEHLRRQVRGSQAPLLYIADDQQKYEECPFAAYAESKGWISRREGKEIVTSLGFKTASSFVKRGVGLLP